MFNPPPPKKKNKDKNNKVFSLALHGNFGSTAQREKYDRNHQTQNWRIMPFFSLIQTLLILNITVCMLYPYIMHTNGWLHGVLINS